MRRHIHASASDYLVSDDGLRGRATRSIGWVVFERWGGRLLGFVVLLVLTRLLNPEEFGLVALATSLIAITQVFVDAGFTKALIQRHELAPKDASTAFWTSLGLSVLIATLVFSFAHPLAAAFGEAELAPILQALSFSLPIIALSRTPAALLERDFNFKALSIRQLFGSLMGAVVAVPVALLGYGAWALIAQTLVAAAGSVIFLWASTSWRPKLEYSLDSLRSLWAVGISMIGIELLDVVQGNIDRVVVGVFFSPETLGYYYIAQRIGLLLIDLITSVLSRVSLTTFSRVQHDIPRLNRIFRKLTFTAAAVSFPMFGLVATFASQLIPGLFGAQWGESVPLVWILAAGWAVLSLMYFDRAALLATSHSGTAFGLAVSQTTLSVIVLFALLPLGLLGVAISRLSRVLSWPARMLLLRRLIGLNIWGYSREILRCLAAILPSLTLVVGFQFTPWSSAPLPLLSFVAPLGLAALALYAVLLWWLAGNENRTMISDTLRPLVKKIRRNPGHS